MTYCQLLFVKRYYRGSAQPSACLYLSAAIAVKSNVDPNKRMQTYAVSVDHVAFVRTNSIFLRTFSIQT